MTSKEALISLNERFGSGIYAWGFNIEKELKAINQDLDRLEKLEEENKALKSDNTALEIWNDAYSTDWNKVKERNEKLEKVINIFKTKDVYIHILYSTDSCYDYNSLMDDINDKLKEEEYELLKEVLEDE